MARSLHFLRQKNQSWRRYRHHLIEENKWRAVRWGVEGKLLDFGRREEVPFAQLLEELLDWVADVVDELGTGEEVGYVHTILKEGTSADRQRKVWEETDDLKAVVDQLMDETLEGC